MILSLVLAVPALPPDAVEYAPAKYTQAISRLTGFDGITRPMIVPVPIKDIDPKWHRSGGMTATMKFTSRKYKSGGKPVYSLGGISVKNSLNAFQTERGILRVYPVGARFDDVLLNDDGVVFEHRTRVKDADGKWRSKIIYRDEDANPKGYAGLGESCASCHNQAASGGYSSGLVPGGDGVLSDPLDWSIVGPEMRDVEK
jgi:hypothetical protein